MNRLKLFYVSGWIDALKSINALIETSRDINSASELLDKIIVVNNSYINDRTKEIEVLINESNE